MSELELLAYPHTGPTDAPLLILGPALGAPAAMWNDMISRAL